MLTQLMLNDSKGWRGRTRTQMRDQVEVEVSPQVLDHVRNQIFRELSGRVGVLARNPVTLKLIRAIREGGLDAY